MGHVKVGFHRWARFGRIHAGGDGRRTARGCAGDPLGPANGATHRQSQALLNAPGITTSKRLRDRSIITVPLVRAPRLSQVAALTGGRRRAEGGRAGHTISRPARFASLGRRDYW